MEISNDSPSHLKILLVEDVDYLTWKFEKDRPYLIHVLQSFILYPDNTQVLNIRPDPVMALRSMVYGLVKYPFDNWKGLHSSRVRASGIRHVRLHLMGESQDLESGLSHLDHINGCLMMLQWHHKNPARDQSSGFKFDKGKLRTDLIPPEWAYKLPPLDKWEELLDEQILSA